MVYFIIIFAIIFIDQISKKIIIENLKIEEKRETNYPKLFWWHKKNYGISYSSFSNHPKQVFFFTFISTIVWCILFMVLLPMKGYGLLKTGFAMILGGGLGNLSDRIRHKCVTDFIYIKGKHAPIFNVADMFVVLGAVLSLLASLKIKD